MTLHGVRRWLLGETLPNQDKLRVLAEWLRAQPQRKALREVILAVARAYPAKDREYTLN